MIRESYCSKAQSDKDIEAQRVEDGKRKDAKNIEYRTPTDAVGTGKEWRMSKFRLPRRPLADS